MPEQTGLARNNAWSWATRLSTAASTLATVALAPQAASATVISVSTRPVTLTWPIKGTSAGWDVDGDSTNDFRLWMRTFGGAFTVLNLDSYNNGRGIVGPGGPYKAANPLAPGFQVGPTLASGTWMNPTKYRTAVHSNGGIGYNGLNQYGFAKFSEGDNYFGFRFENNSDPNLVYYGWANINFGPLNSGQRTVTITNWAYNDVPNEPVIVGQPPASVPGPIGLAGLAAGAAWTRKLRRRIRNTA